MEGEAIQASARQAGWAEHVLRKHALRPAVRAAFTSSTAPKTFKRCPPEQAGAVDKPGGCQEHRQPQQCISETQYVAAQRFGCSPGSPNSPAAAAERNCRAVRGDGGEQAAGQQLVGASSHHDHQAKCERVCEQTTRRAGTHGGGTHLRGRMVGRQAPPQAVACTCPPVRRLQSLAQLSGSGWPTRAQGAETSCPHQREHL